jgi:hypothetical protein
MHKFVIASVIACSVVSASAKEANRKITVVSQCKGQTIVVGYTGGAVQNCGPNNSCPTGTACSNASNPPQCFWTLPEPTQGTNVLKSGESVTYTLTAPSINETVTSHGVTNTINVKWSGNMYARSGCQANGSGCQTALCGSGSCSFASGPTGPVSLVEYTLSATGPDYYDVSLISGSNVPVMMSPTPAAANPGSLTTRKATAGAGADSNPFFCGVPGNIFKDQGLPACSWQFSPPSNLAAYAPAVAPGGAACTSSSSCPQGQVCGLTLNLAVNTTSQTCGTQLGWWTANGVCQVTGNGYNSVGAPVNCTTSSNVDLYNCTGTNATSCYNSAATNTCCGCPSWPGVRSLMTCVSTNPNWTAAAMPWAQQWAQLVKDACPTAYSFPFDDGTSTFTCNTENPATNAMDYTITFCPGGKTGL